jgi:glycosyltransferase involved in cell wall biosynthesis
VISLRHGIDLEAVESSRDDRSVVRAEIGLGADEFVFVTAASFTPQKDYPNLLRAVHSLAQAHVACRVLILGQGPDEDDIVRLSNELGLGERVVFAGFRADATRILAACDVFVLASAWEGLPVSIMEACALGLPIVATRTGGIADEFVDGVDALVVPIHDSVSLAAAMRRVRDEPELRERLAAGARVKAARFDVRRTHNEIESIYRNAALTRMQRQGSQ